MLDNYLKQYLKQEVAERTGLEPATPGVTGRYSNQLNYRSAKSVIIRDTKNRNVTGLFGGWYRDRTCDIRLVRATLSQLS